MSGVQVSECGPGGRRVSVVQATLVARLAVWIASSFTFAARLSAKLTTAVSRPGTPGETVAKSARSPA